MSSLFKHAPPSQRQVSALRKQLNRRHRLIVICSVLFGCLSVDAVLPARYQALANVAIGFVDVYQVVGRPVTRRFVRCRFQPSCSDYSKAVFAKYGFWLGAFKTLDRLSRCRASTPMGTVDEP
jgi:putative component of membrane protein insertase Oxa1/YidC/SpoIIIJ protein YidD